MRDNTNYSNLLSRSNVLSGKFVVTISNNMNVMHIAQQFIRCDLVDMQNAGPKTT